MKLRIVAVAATLAATVVTVLPAEAATAPVSGGVYTLANGASGKCLEVAGGSVDNGALLQQSACDATAARQQWRRRSIARRRQAGRCG